MEIKKITQLQKLTDLVMQADLATLRQTSAERENLEQELAYLSAASGEDTILTNGSNSAQFCGAHHRWDLWRERTRISLNQKLARLRVRQQEELQAIRKSFGRDQAVQDILDRRLTETARERSRSMS